MSYRHSNYRKARKAADAIGTAFKNNEEAARHHQVRYRSFMSTSIVTPPKPEGWGKRRPKTPRIDSEMPQRTATLEETIRIQYSRDNKSQAALAREHGLTPYRIRKILGKS